eukprot:Em0326g3a
MNSTVPIKATYFSCSSCENVISTSFSKKEDEQDVYRKSSNFTTCMWKVRAYVQVSYGKPYNERRKAWQALMRILLEDRKAREEQYEAQQAQMREQMQRQRERDELEQAQRREQMERQRERDELEKNQMRETNGDAP